MLALFLNLGHYELMLIAVVAVLIFGRRLPEVAAQAYGQVARARQALEKLRRETGIDKELRNIEHEVRDAARKGRIQNPLLPPSGLRSAWDAAQKKEEEAHEEENRGEEATETSGEGESDSSEPEDSAASKQGQDPAELPFDDTADRRERS